jgi:hypothetical protein
MAGLPSAANAATRTFTGLGLTANGQGYLLVSSAGEFYAYGNAHPQPNPTGSSGIVGVAVTADGQGALAVSNSGQFYAYGTAHAWNNITVSSGIVGVAVTADGQGALAVSKTGQFYAYGTAHPQPNPTGFSGSIVGVALTADGQGALAVSSAGQFYAYGTAHPQPNPVGFTHTITAVTMTADGQGAVAMSDTGQFYAYGTAHPQPNPTGFTGSMVGVKLTANGQGLTAMSSTGQIYANGSSAWLGNGDPGAASTPPSSSTLTQRIVSNAIAEAGNSTRNRERAGNCNYYTGALKAGQQGCGSDGWQTQPGGWCADFARWVWKQSGARTDGLDSGAASFTRRGYRSGSSPSNARVGDAVVFRYNGAGYAEHVGIVTAINANGTINYTSGNTGNPTPKGADGIFTKTITPSSAGVSGYASPTS